MSKRSFCLGWLALCVGCVGAQRQATTPVIIAGSVCSELPAIAPLTASTAAESGDAAGAGSLIAFVSGKRAEALSVYDLNAGRVRFQVLAHLRARPQLLSSLVVAVDQRGDLVAYELAAGAPRFRASIARANWLGAVEVGSLVVTASSSLSFRPGERGSTLTALDAASGRQIWQREVPFGLGRPAVFGGRLFVLSDHADVWELDARSGADIGCARTGASGPLDWIEAAPAGLFMGARDARQLSAAGPAPAQLSLPIADLPGRPQLRPSAYEVVPAARSAHGRVSVQALLEHGDGAPRLAGDRYVFGFYRELFGYRADGGLVWARLLDSDVVRLQLVGSQLLALTEDGSLLRFDVQTGSQLARTQLPGDVGSADMRARKLPELAAAESARPLRTALAEMALDTDARLLPGRLLAVAELAALPDPEATADLLHVYVQPGAPPALRERVAALLPSRRVGGEYLVDALLDDYDFLEDRSAPPLAAIVPSLVALHETRAVPRLVERLFDPDTQLDDLAGLVNAIAELGDESASQPLARFLSMYHADSSLAANPSALVAAARALLARAAGSAQLVQAIANSTITSAKLRPLLVELLSKPPEVAPAPAAVASAPPLQAASEWLSDAEVKRVFAQYAGELRVCVLSELGRNPALRQLRLSFVLKSDGALAGLQVLPDHPELLQCLRTQLASLRFPPFKAARRLASYTIAVHSDAVSEVLSQPGDERAEQPFWRVAELRAGPMTQLPVQPPWWQNQNPLFVAVDDSLSAAPTPAPAPAPAATTAPANGKEPTPAKVDQWWLPTTGQ